MYTKSERLARLIRLRAVDAPKWIIRSEQVALVLARKGLKHRGLGRKWSKTQEELYEKYVSPEMEDHAKLAEN